MNALDYQRLSYPRVSDIISAQNEAEYRGIPLEVLVNAQNRGIKIHDYCTAIVNALWPPEIEKEYQPYVDAFVNWYETNVSKTLFTGIRLYDDVKRFTGEFDLIVTLKESNQVALLDIKTSLKESKAWRIQLGAYKHLCELNSYPPIDVVYNIHLKRTKAGIFDKIGEEKVMISPPHVEAVPIQHEDTTLYWEIFASALSCYNYFHNKEEIQC